MFKKRSSADKEISLMLKEFNELKLKLASSLKSNKKESKFTIPQKLLILHYIGVFALFKKDKNRNVILSTILDCHEQTVKETAYIISDFETVKTSENLNLLLNYFKLHKMNEQVLVIENDILKLHNKLNNNKLTKK